ncbi:MAG: helix-turn-helix transcriptional regulator [Candidatus Faecousia sp.]|nr:helix-turn-helix transcriptional regulator [Bacillota bacterium]MDY4220348.1 helix-turn-helix transcriptional regulator [Candidatus Faecousia sp.]
MFRKETGQTISAYVSHIRIEKSKALLRQPGVPIAEIAGLCGFEDQSYFTRVFKKQTGISPKQYRNNALEEL